MVSQTHRWEFQSMTSFRKFLSIASQCGDGLRPELQALFERLAVDPHSGLFVRNDGMVQSGPDPISAKAPLAQNPGETRTSNCGQQPASCLSQKIPVLEL